MISVDNDFKSKSNLDVVGKPINKNGNRKYTGWTESK